MAKPQRTVRGSKRYKKAVDSVDRDKRYDVGGAINAIKNAPAAKFDETVDLVVRLGIDLKRNDGGVRGTLTLPHGIGKTKTVIAFCEGELAEQATAAGAMEAGGEDLVKKVQDTIAAVLNLIEQQQLGVAARRIRELLVAAHVLLPTTGRG